MNPTMEKLMQSEAIAIALGTPDIIEWPEGRAYAKANAPAAVGDVLVRQIHRHLVDAKIAFVFREKMKTRDRLVLGKASKAGAKLEFFSDLDLVVEVNFEAWSRLTPDQRVALIDHELCHFGVEETEKGMEYVLLSHDVEEVPRHSAPLGPLEERSQDLRGYRPERAARDLGRRGDERRMTKLTKKLIRYVEIEGVEYRLEIYPEGVRIVRKGFRQGAELSWRKLIAEGKQS